MPVQEVVDMVRIEDLLRRPRGACSAFFSLKSRKGYVHVDAFVPGRSDSSHDRLDCLCETVSMNFWMEVWLQERTRSFRTEFWPIKGAVCKLRHRAREQLCCDRCQVDGGPAPTIALLGGSKRSSTSCWMMKMQTLIRPASLLLGSMS